MIERKATSLENLRGIRVTVVGLGRFGGGVGVTRWLCGVGAKVTVSDSASADDLAESVSLLDQLDVRMHLGSHLKDDFLSADLLVVNPAVPKHMPLLREAQAAGVARTSEINLFLQSCPCPIIGVTGTAGKSTTSAMTTAVLSRRYKTHLGGNIGGSLLNSLPDIARDHLVVMELSSFQLEDLPLARISPHIAVVTNLANNHLDRHGTMAAYTSAKMNILKYQNSDDVLILNSTCDQTRQWAQQAQGHVEWFDPMGDPFELQVLGSVNQANAQAAWSVASQFGIDRSVATEALRDYQALPHRLSLVAEIGGVRFYNDSKSTTPAGTIAAMEAFQPREVLVIVGGSDKGIPLDRLASVLCDRAKAVVAIGAMRDKIASAIRATRTKQLPLLELAEDLPAAMATVVSHADAGDVVLLSPACASYDMFVNYRQRGNAFVELVGKLASDR